MKNQTGNEWYEKSWLAILLCIVFFPVGLFALWKNHSIGKAWKIVITIFIGICVIGIVSNTDESPANSQTTTKKSEKKWTVVYSFNGNGMKKSPTFELTGGSARIKYKYQAEGGLGVGMFSVYVVDEGSDIMVDGGIPEVMSQAENEESESSIQKGAGRYYLNVNAAGNWTVSVEEQK